MSNELAAFLWGAALNLVVAIVIVRFIYYPRTRDQEYVFTFLAFNTVIYFVLALLRSTDLGVGVGFGLFAIFSVLRYRTDPIPIREMTYLFIIIALPVVNSMIGTDEAVWKLLVADGVVMGLMAVLEREWGFCFEASNRVTYDQIALIVPERRAELLADLQERTGLPVKRVEIGRLDFLRDAAEMRVYYDAPKGALAPARTGGLDAATLDDE